MRMCPGDYGYGSERVNRAPRHYREPWQWQPKSPVQRMREGMVPSPQRGYGRDGYPDQWDAPPWDNPINDLMRSGYGGRAPWENPWDPDPSAAQMNNDRALARMTGLH
jgi:hypothetical protein